MTNSENYKSIGGWLIYFAIDLALFSAWLVMRAGGNVAMFLGLFPGVEANIFSPFIAVGYFLLLALCIRTQISFYRRRKATPKQYVSLYVLSGIFHLVISLIGWGNGVLVARTFYEPGRHFICAAIGAIYYRRSKRSAKTFIM